MKTAERDGKHSMKARMGKERRISERKKMDILYNMIQII